MRSLLFVLFLGILSTKALGQKHIDSLRNELRQSGLPDSTRVDLYNDLSFYYASVDPVNGLAYSDSAFQLAKKLGLESRATTSINNKGVNYWYQGNDSLASEAYREVMEAHQKSGNRKGQASAVNNIALIKYNQGDYRGALESHESASAIFEELGLVKNIINSYSNTGVVFLALADYPMAMDYFLKALGRCTDQDVRERGNLYTNLGLVYKNLDNLPEAEDYHRKAMGLYREEGIKQSLTSSMANLGAVLQLRGELAEAEALFSESLILNKEIGNKRRIASGFTALGSLFMETRRLTLAGNYLDSARGLYSELGEKLGLSTVLLQLAELENRKAGAGDLKKALGLEQKALELAAESGSLEAQRSAWKALAGTQEALGDFRNSLFSYQRYQTFQDSIFNDENEKKLLSLQIGHDFEMREKTLTAGFQTEKQLLEAEKESERLKASLYLIGIAALILIGGGGFLAVRQQQKSRQEKLASEFRAQVAELELKALKAQMNPHFIFNALSSISSFLLKNQADQADRYLTRFSRLIRRILEYSDVNEISLAMEVDLLKDYIAIEALRLGKPVEFELVAEEGVDLDRLMIPPLILQPLVENSLWHGIANSGENGLITLKASRQDEGFLLVLRDNGTGIRETVQVREKHQSMGMRLVKSRLENLSQNKKSSSWSVFWENLAPGFEVRLSFSPNKPLNLT